MRVGILAALALSISACGLGDSQHSMSNEQSRHSAQNLEPEDPAALEPDKQASENGVDPLEEFASRLAERGPGAFRFDRIRDARAGGKERQVFVEMLGPDDRDAADLSAEILESIGLVPGHSFGDENGIRLSYKYDGGELLRVLVRTREAHSKLVIEGATSSVYLTLPLAPSETD